jgi:hypothetical protein
VSEQKQRDLGYGPGEETSRRDGERFEQDFRGRGPRGYQRSSERILEDVCERLTDDREVDASDLDVDVENGIVTLRGSVADRRQKRRAEDVAEQARGVRDVRNQLELGDRELVDDLAARVGRSEEDAGRDLGEYRDPSWRLVDFRGFDAEARDGSIGSVDKRSEVGGDHLVIDTGTWIFGRKVVLPVGLIERADLGERRLFVSRSKDEIKNAPELRDDRIDDPSYGEELRAYYGRQEAGERALR